MIPVFSITGPELTYTLPKQPAAAGIADIFSHLLEQYLHNDPYVDVSDYMLLGVMKAGSMGTGGLGTTRELRRQGKSALGQLSGHESGTGCRPRGKLDLPYD